MTQEETGSASADPATRLVVRPVAMVAGGFLGAAVLITSVQVVLRFAFNQPLAWAEEIGRYLFVWSVYAGFLLAVVKRSHIRVTVVVDALPRGVRRAMNAIVHLVTILAFAFVVYQGAGLALDNTDRQFYTVPFLTLVMLYAAVPLTMTLACLSLLVGPWVRRRAGQPMWED